MAIDDSGVAPHQTVNVPMPSKVVLVTPDGKPLARVIGFSMPKK
jgi:hypothetical protein